jgi:hypothetical protein
LTSCKPVSFSRRTLLLAGSNPAEAVGFFLCKKSSARLPSEEKLNNLSHVPTLEHVKDPFSRGLITGCKRNSFDSSLR